MTGYDWSARDILALDPYRVDLAATDVVAALGSDLTTVEDNVRLVAELLGQVSTHGVWESPSGETFAREVGDVPVTLRQVAARMGDAGERITCYSRTLRTTQEEMARTAAAHERTCATLAEIDRQLALYAPHPAEDALRARRAEAHREVLAHESAYAAASEDARRDEALLAADLDEVCTDLADPRGYDALEGTRDLGRSALFTGPWAGLLKPLALGTALDPLGQAGLRVAYGHGSWRRIASDSKLLVADGVIKGSGRVLRSTRGVSTAATAVGRTTRTASPARAPRAFDQPWHVTARQSTTRLAARSRELAVAKGTQLARDRSGLALADELAADWRAVSGASRPVKVVQGVASSTKVARHVGRTADTVGTTRERLRPVTDADAHERERRDARREDRRRAAAAHRVEEPTPP